MDDILKLNMVQMIRYFQNLSSEEFDKLFEEKNKILDLNVQTFNLIYLNVNDTCKKKILDDKDLFDKVMKLPFNRVGKSSIDLSSKEIQQYIYNHVHLLTSEAGKLLMANHLSKMKREEVSLLFKNENLQEAFQGVVDSIKCADPEISGMVQASIRNGQFRNIAVFQIHNDYELFIYAKFGILVGVSDFKDDRLVIDSHEIAYDFVRRVNRKHMLSLFLLCQDKNDVHNNEMFISIMNLYLVFGLDNSKKILNDFFTFATDASVKRASDELFKDNRRAFRLSNQDKYYYYRMEEDFLEAYQKRDREYFRAFCMSKEDSYIEAFLAYIENAIRGMEGREKLEIVKKIIVDEIEKRENYYYEKDIMKYQKYYYSTARKEKIKLHDIYQLVGNVNLNYQLTKDGKIIPDLELEKFLLGNFKKDNDCLLRMVLNKQALGLDDELGNIISHFEKIREVASRDETLSLNSVLDVIDISKVFLYQLKPDELDITLGTLSKLLHSRKYCTEPPKEILRRTLELHKKRKHKISCAIDFFEGKIDGAYYKIKLPDEEDLLSSGIDSGSCFKVGGKGEDFFEYCLTNPKGLVLSIEYQGVCYILPASVNGNMLNINSIDPIIKEENVYREFIYILEQIVKIIVDDDRNKIELATITDVHHEKFMNHCDYESILFEQFIPLSTSIYSDYNKKEVMNYCLYPKDKEVGIKYFDNRDEFYQPRLKPYIFSPTHEADQERIKIYMNSIAYSSISFQNSSELEKNRERDYYHELEIEDFLYIVGNKDWFIGIMKDKRVVEYCLPYDNRALMEYQKYEELIDMILNHLDDDVIKRK